MHLGISPNGGTNSKGGWEKLLFSQFSPKNVMKLKEFGPEEGVSLVLLRYANDIVARLR